MESHGWQVIAEEHPWRDPDSDGEGFIDLVIGQNTNNDLHRMIVECKRTREADWVFLLPGSDRNGWGSHLRCMWVSTYPENLRDGIGVRSGHHNFYVAPESYISQFCAVRGTGEGQSPMLENLSRSLLSSVERFAREEIDLWLQGNITGRRYYVPVIVTNARLSVCKFKLASVSLNEGNISDGDFEEVPYIRFTKSLTTAMSAGRPIRTIGEANLNRHRTVLVVQAARLIDLMTNWRLPVYGSNPLPQW